ncbi:O-antigen ligase family protein [Undibacterium sp.]|jgi:O-antigen ligase|uniref:O-antigen ligase family protein n=1 Tax=Undibacterium sp. TaxID=1914977 RepID=UPI002C9A5B29|nr:O-antigen ligase family protein [Undibacterium sp.]HTD03166.1 O-antigen ligase family protein [Undibacterium sp.]
MSSRYQDAGGGNAGSSNGNVAGNSRHALRAVLPQHVLSVLPLTLFFPLGWMYAGVVLFLLSLALSGNYREKGRTILASPMLKPILSLSLVSCLVAIFLPRPAGEFWSAFVHYQTYLFLLLFLCVGAGEWQRRAVVSFLAGALIAASLFYLNFLQVLPVSTMTRSYVIYQGNKSILLGILLALAAGWLLNRLVLYKEHRWKLVLVFFYIVVALLFLSKSRTASLIMICLCALIPLCRLRFSWRSAVALGAVVLLLWLGLQYALSLPTPEKCAVRDMQLQGYSPPEIMRDRGLCTLRQARAFAHGENAGEDGMRAEIYQLTGKIAAEKPWTGHGIASWLIEYQARARGLASGTMTTPHNDYLLYATEIGIFGLAALLWIWLTQLLVARKIGDEHGMMLAMLAVTMIIGGMFNAILRDAVFGMAFMILLAIPLAGVRSSELSKQNDANRVRQ